MVRTLPSADTPLYDPTNLSLIALLVVALLMLAASYFWKPIAEYWRKKKMSGLEDGSWDSATGYVFGKNALGRIIYAPIEKDGKHTFILGGSGSGKTSSVLIPTLQHFGGNFLAIDIAGDISKAVVSPGSLIFAPYEQGGSVYNIFGMIDSIQDTAEKQEQLEKLAFLLMPDIPGASDSSLFFNTEGRRILIAALFAFYKNGYDFVDICRIILASSCKDLFRGIEAQSCEAATMLIRSFAGTSDASMNGCKQAADAAIRLFALNQNIRASVRRPKGCESSITPAALEKHSVFLNIPEFMLDVYAPVLRIVVAQCLAYFGNRPLNSSVPIMLALDEYPSLGIDATSIVGALQRFRKRNVSIMIVAQSMAALDRVYGPITRKDMLNNFMYKVILHAGDADTQIEIARMIGHKMAVQTSKTTTLGATSITTREGQAWAVEPESLGRLNKHLVLIHPAGYDKLKKAPYYEYE